MNFSIDVYSYNAIIRIQKNNSDQTIEYSDIPHVYLDNCKFDADFETHIYDLVLNLLEEDEIRTIIVDLQNIDYLNSKELGTLIYCDTLAILKYKEFGIINIKESILKTFKVLSIDEILKVFEEEKVISNEKIKQVTG